VERVDALELGAVDGEDGMRDETRLPEGVIFVFSSLPQRVSVLELFFLGSSS
jgi:hypothetical protein